MKIQCDCLYCGAIQFKVVKKTKKFPFVFLDVWIEQTHSDKGRKLKKARLKADVVINEKKAKALLGYLKKELQ